MKERDKKNKVKLSIIIVGLNVKEYLIPCLKSIFSNPPSFSLEVIYVDNGSSDHSTVHVKSFFPQVKIIKSKVNLGFAKANNLGFKHSSGEYLFFLNPDTKIVNQSLSQMINFMETHKKVGILGPKLYNSEKMDLQVSSTGELTPLTAIFSLSFINKIWPNNPYSKRYFLTDWKRNCLKEVDVVSGAALLIKSDIFKKIGGFDERFFLYFEENDLCLRVKKLNLKVVYYPRAEIIHFGGRATKKIPKLTKKSFRESRYKFFEKHYGRTAAVATEGFLRFFEFLAQII